jgi:SAM-dependent methyltransferase
VIGDDILELLEARVPGDHSRQAVADRELPRWLAAAPGRRVLDLGCGDGRSIDLFRAADPAVEWTGVDIESSPEVAERTRSDAEFHTFDGVHLPFADGTFDLVWCKQVLEHVRDPAPLLGEAARVLAPDGVFCGSTSQLEPFHSRSTANLTPYGAALLLEDAGLSVRELRPSIDALTLIVRRGVGRRGAIFHRWWDQDSPLNSVISGYGRLKGADHRRVNAAKLIFCGQFTFLAVRGERDRHGGVAPA